MRLLTYCSFILMFVLLSVTVSAQIQYYGIETYINDMGTSFVNLTLTFAKPEDTFRLAIIGRINNFQARDINKPLNCSVTAGGISNINCELTLTTEKRTIYMNYETDDFIKTMENTYFFSNDFSLNRDVNNTYISIRLAEGFALSEAEVQTSKLSFPENITTISDGRRIILIWKLADLKANEKLRLEFLYERLPSFLPPAFRLRYIAVFGAAVAFGLGFIWLRYFRKPEKLILSVLDDFERKVMDIIVANNGVVNQRKVVQETNLSKAKVSRVVKSLVERGIVEVERMGRSNKLKLVKKKFSI